MLCRLHKEEAGMTMGLVVVMIVLIGVMGAGLLTFVQRDLGSVVEVNQGQKAVEVSDAGVQAARKQLLSVSYPESYNGNNLTDPATKPESEWSFASPTAVCGSLPAGPGKCIRTGDGDVRVEIRYLPPPTATSGAGSKEDPNRAPEDLPAGAVDFSNKDYFRIETDGVFSGARRKIQAIYVTEDLNLPKAYFATQNIELKGSATGINGVSLFARGNISGVRDGLLTGTDLAYGDWFNAPSGGTNAFNNKARIATSTLPANSPGVAAEGNVSGSTQGIIYSDNNYNREQKTNPTANSDRYKRLDFDGITDVSLVDGATTTGPPGRRDTLASPTPNYKFCDKGATSCWPSGAQPANVITYPFNDGAKLDAAFLQSLAEEQINPATGQDNYVTTAGGAASTVTIDENNFFQVVPQLSSVYVVRFTGPSKGKVSYSPNTAGYNPVGAAVGSCPVKGTILVINGDFDTSSSGDKCFDGIVAMQDTNSLGTLTYENLGSFSLNGFANVEGTMKIGGSVNPILGADVLNNPGYHDVKLWSWRECYNAACN